MPLKLYSLRRLPMTLIEIVIVLVILAAIGGAIGINILKSLKEQRFRMESSGIVDTFRLAQDLMLVMGADVNVRFKGSAQGIQYWLAVEGGVPPQWEPIIAQSRKTLKEVHGIFFRDMQPFPVNQGEVDVHFQSQGAAMSKGVLRMSTHAEENVPGALVMAVCLQGYPHPITGEMETGMPIECFWENEEEFNRKLTFYTLQEIAEEGSQKGGT